MPGKMKTAKARDRLAEALRRGGDAPQSVEEYWRRQKGAWLDDLHALRTRVRGWLAPLVEDRLATVEDREFAADEPDYGHYVAPGLEISLLSDEPRSVVLLPRGGRIQGIAGPPGKRVVGASGRVDVECGPNREILLRIADKGGAGWWSFAGGEKRALDEELFFELVARVADVRLV
jgi:hypothetical protein